MRHYKAIIFDAGDTLYDATPWRKWLTEQLQGAGVKITYAQLVERWENLLVDVYLGKADYWKRFEEFLKNCGLENEQVQQLKKSARQKGKDFQVGRTPFDGVVDTLARLKKNGIKLVVLSDTESTSRKVRDGLRNIGIGQYFDAVLTSFDIGYIKPQPEAYSTALSEIGAQKENTLFVGHDKDELDGAKNFGLATIAYNSPQNVKADHIIEDFRDISKITK